MRVAQYQESSRLSVSPESILTTCKLMLFVFLSPTDAGYLPLLGVEQTDCNFGAGSLQCQNCSDALTAVFCLAQILTTDVSACYTSGALPTIRCKPPNADIAKCCTVSPHP